MLENTPIGHEQFAGPQSAFEVIDPHVDPAVVNLVRMAEQTGALERLPAERAERMVEYLTAPISLRELGVYFGISLTSAKTSVHGSLDILAADIFKNRGRDHDEQLKRSLILNRWKQVKVIKR